MEINSVDYWEDRFRENWESRCGYEQTAFFGRVALELMPEWVRREIVSKQMSICDVGCACGQATELLHKELGVPVEGTDFSAEAIETASKLFPGIRFFVSDITTPNPDAKKFGVAFCSNVLEHIENTWPTAANLTQQATDFLLIMLPFREDPLDRTEHVRRFDSDSIPLTINNWPLVSATALDCASLPQSCYLCPQILLVYANPARGGSRQTTLGDLSQSLESLTADQRIDGQHKEIDELQEQLASAQKEATGYNALLYDARTSLAQKEKDMMGLAQVAMHYRDSAWSQAKENEKLRKDLSIQQTQLNNQIEKLHEALSVRQTQLDTQIDNNTKLRSSHSWKIGRAITCIPRLGKKMIRKMRISAKWSR